MLAARIKYLWAFAYSQDSQGEYDNFPSNTMGDNSLLFRPSHIALDGISSA
jgi:hypothetical protein